MQYIKRITMASIVVGMLGAAQVSMAAVDPSADQGTPTDQVHRPRDPFTDGGHSVEAVAPGATAAIDGR